MSARCEESLRACNIISAIVDGNEQWETRKNRGRKRNGGESRKNDEILPNYFSPEVEAAVKLRGETKARKLPNTILTRNKALDRARKTYILWRLSETQTCFTGLPKSPDHVWRHK